MCPLMISIECQGAHQDDYHNILVSIQADNQSNIIKQHKQRETIRPTCLYLESDLMSSFYQVFSDKYRGSEAGESDAAWEVQHWQSVLQQKGYAA